MSPTTSIWHLDATKPMPAHIFLVKVKVAQLDVDSTQEVVLLEHVPIPDRHLQQTVDDLLPGHLVLQLKQGMQSFHTDVGNYNIEFSHTCRQLQHRD